MRGDDQCQIVAYLVKTGGLGGVPQSALCSLDDWFALGIRIMLRQWALDVSASNSN